MSDKPIPESEPIERWTAQGKAAIILEVLKGQIWVPEAARKYGFTQCEYRKWADEYHQAGVEVLKINRKDQEAKHQAEIKRLRAKIGQLVMTTRSGRRRCDLFFRAIRRRACGRLRLRSRVRV